MEVGYQLDLMTSHLKETIMEMVIKSLVFLLRDLKIMSKDFSEELLMVQS